MSWLEVRFHLARWLRFAALMAGLVFGLALATALFGHLYGSQPSAVCPAPAKDQSRLPPFAGGAGR